MDINLDAQDKKQLVLFPEMDEKAEVPEITTACWDILGVNPDDMMCASSRMVVKRKGAGRGAQWVAAVTHDSTARGMVGKLVDHLFEGSADRLAAHLVEGGQLNSRQLAELSELIEQHFRRPRKKKGTAE